MNHRADSALRDGSGVPRRLGRSTGLTPRLGCQVFAEPIHHPGHDIDLIGVPEEIVAFAGVYDELRLYAHAPQSIPILVRLTDRYLGVAIAPRDQGRCMDVFDEC